MFVPSAVIVFAVFSVITNPETVIKSAPISLNIPSLNLPAVWFDAAVIVFPFPISTTGFNALVVDKTNEPAPPITYPPEGAVCGFPESKFIVTPPAPTP